MPKLVLFSNGSSKTTTRVVPLRFRYASPDSTPMVAVGRPPVDDRDRTAGPTVGAYWGPRSGPDDLTIWDFTVRVARQMLDPSSPLRVVLPPRLTVEASELYSAPSERRFDLAVVFPPTMPVTDTQPYEAHIRVHWSTPDDVELARLRLVVYQPLSVPIYFWLVTVGKNFPPFTAGDIQKYVDVINAIYQPAGIWFYPIVGQMSPKDAFEPRFRDGAVHYDSDIVLLLRQAHRNAPGHVHLLIVDVATFEIQGMGIGPHMIRDAQGREMVKTADVYRNPKDKMALAIMMRSSVIPDERSDPENIRTSPLWEEPERRTQTLGQGGLDPYEDCDVWGQTHPQEASMSKNSLPDYQKFLAQFGVLYDPEGNIRDSFDPSKQPEKVVVRFTQPGIIAARVNATGELPPSETLIWGRFLAHEIGHYFGLFHPNNPRSLNGQPPDETIWSNERLLYTRGTLAPGGPIHQLLSLVGATRPRDIGYGDDNPGYLITHTHIDRGGVELDPPGGEIQTLRKNVRAHLAELEAAAVAKASATETTKA